MLSGAHPREALELPLSPLSLGTGASCAIGPTQNLGGTSRSTRSTSPRTGFSKKKVPAEKPAHEFATQTRANALDPAQLDPKRARRIIANRQSAHKSRLKKLNRVHTLEKEVEDAQALTDSLRLDALNREAVNAQLVASLEAARTMALKLQVQVQQQVVVNQTFRSEFARLTGVLRERQQAQQAQQQQATQEQQQQQQEQQGGGGRGLGCGGRSGGCEATASGALPDIAEVEEQLGGASSGPASMATTHGGPSLLSQAVSYESMQTLSTATPPGSLPQGGDVLPTQSPTGSDIVMDSSPLINMPTLTFPGSDPHHRVGAAATFLQHHSAGMAQDPLALASSPGEAPGASGTGGAGNRQFGDTVRGDGMPGSGLPASLLDPTNSGGSGAAQFDLGLPDLSFSHDLFMSMPNLYLTSGGGGGGGGAGAGAAAAALPGGQRLPQLVGRGSGGLMMSPSAAAAAAAAVGSACARPMALGGGGLPALPPEAPPLVGLGSLDMRELAAASAGQDNLSPMGLSPGMSLLQQSGDPFPAESLAEIFARGSL